MRTSLVFSGIVVQSPQNNPPFYLPANSIDQSMMRDNSVGTAQMLNLSVTSAKLGADVFQGTLLNNVALKSIDVPGTGTVDLIKFDNSSRLQMGGLFYPQVGTAIADQILVSDATGAMSLINRRNITRAHYYWYANVDAATVTTVGMTAPTITGVISQAFIGTPPAAPRLFNRYRTTTTSGTSAGLISAIAYTGAMLPEFEAWICPDSAGDGDGYHIEVGWMSADTVGAANTFTTGTPPNIQAVMFCGQITNGAGAGSSNWFTYTAQTSAAFTRNASAVAFNQSPVLLRAKYVDASTVQFFINNVLVATHTTNLPLSSVVTGFGIRITTTATEAHDVGFARVRLSHY